MPNYAITFMALLDKVTTTKDGGARITLDVGLESLSEIQQLLDLIMNNKTMVQIAIVPNED